MNHSVRSKQLFIVCLGILCLGQLDGLSGAERQFCEGENCAPETFGLHFGGREGPSTLRGLRVGDEFVVTLALHDTDNPILSLELGIGHPHESVEIVEITPNTELLNLNPAHLDFQRATRRGDVVIPDPDRDPTRLDLIVLLRFGVYPTLKTFPLGKSFSILTVRYRVIEPLALDSTNMIEFTNELSIQGAPNHRVGFAYHGVPGKWHTQYPMTVIDCELLSARDTATPCATWALRLGVDESEAVHAITGKTFDIGIRNPAAVSGVSFALRMIGDHYAFLAPSRDSQISIENTEGGIHEPVTNLAVGPDSASMMVEDVSLSLPLMDLPIDFVVMALGSEGESNGFEVSLTTQNSGTANAIPPTSGTANDCSLSPLLHVTLNEIAPTTRRGDVNGDGFIDIADGAVLAQNLFFDRLVSFKCETMRDVNPDGVLDSDDPITLLSYRFSGELDSTG